MLGQRSGVRRQPGLHSSRHYVAFISADVNMNDVRQEPGLTDADCVVSTKLATPIAVKV